MNYKFKILSEKNIDEIVDLVHKLNENKIPKNILTKRQKEMFSQNYECMGVFIKSKLIGLSDYGFKLDCIQVVRVSWIMFIFFLNTEGLVSGQNLFPLLKNMFAIEVSSV